MKVAANSRVSVIPRWALVFLLSVCPAVGQQSSDLPTAQTRPGGIPATEAKIHVRTDLVLVPVVVRDRQGRHMSSLTKDAFRLEENGKEQALTLFQEVEPQPGEVRDSGPEPGFSNLPFDSAQNLELTVLVLDLLNTSPLQRANGKDLLVRFLEKGLAQNEPVSLLCITAKGLQLVHPFSTDSAVLIDALKKVPPGAERIMPRRDAVASTLKQLRQIAEAYIGIPGRKSLIFAAGDLPDPLSEPGIYFNTHSARDVFQEVWKTLAAANVSVYPVGLAISALDPTIPRQRLRISSSQASLRGFAYATGGNLCLEGNDVMGCLGEAVEDSRSYYMLGFAVRSDDRKPGWRDLKVKVSAEHARVRVRDGFYYEDPSLPSPETARQSEVEALASPLAISAIPMRVRVLPWAAKANAPSLVGAKKAVEFMLTIPLNGIKLDPSGDNPLNLEVGAIAITTDPREVAEFLHPVHGNPNPELLRKLSREGIQLREKLDLLPGSYEVRCMVRDNNTTLIGTVVFPVEIQ